MDFIPKYVENELGCPPMKELHNDFVISCSNQNKIEPWKPND